MAIADMVMSTYGKVTLWHGYTLTKIWDKSVEICWKYNSFTSPC